MHTIILCLGWESDLVQPWYTINEVYDFGVNPILNNQFPDGMFRFEKVMKEADRT